MLSLKLLCKVSIDIYKLINFNDAKYFEINALKENVFINKWVSTFLYFMSYF